MRVAKQGICHICGYLQSEHVPPKTAFILQKIKMISEDQLFVGKSGRRPRELAGMRGELRQQGSGIYALCETCNITTGAWYGSSYMDFSHLIAKLVGEHKEVRPNDYVFQTESLGISC